MLMHGDTIPRIFAELKKCQRCRLMDSDVRGGQVGDQGGDCTVLAKSCPVAAPIAAVADGQGQLGAQHIVGSDSQLGELLGDAVVRNDGQVFLVPTKQTKSSID